jgi:hypothetical protein
MNDIFQEAASNQNRAWNIIDRIGIIDIWKSIGAEINLVGSLKTGLLMNNLDIDFHIYTEDCSVSDSFRAISLLVENHQFKKIIYANLLHEPDTCLEWHAYYEDELHDLWQIDMIHMTKASPYSGVFEDVAAKILKGLTPEYKESILTIKNAAFKLNQKISGIKIYRAVMEGKVKTHSEYLAYEAQHKDEGIILWKP